MPEFSSFDQSPAPGFSGGIIIHHPERLHYGWIILFVGVLTVFSSLGLARFGYTMILPPMQDGLQLNNTQAGYLATGNFIGYLGLALVGGFLASHFGPRRVICISLLVVSLTMILTGLAKDFYSALLWRTLTGMGSGASNVPMMGLLSAWFAPRRRGLATGIAVSGSSFGLIFTGPLVPYVIQLTGEGGWRIAWFVLGGLVLIIALLARIFLHDSPEIKQCSAIGFEPAHAMGGVDRNHSLSLLGGWALVIKSPAVWHLSLIYFMFGFSYIIYITFFARYLQAELGWSKAASGNLWQMVGWISLSCGLIWGWVSDKAGRKYALALVFLVQTTAYLLFAFWTSPAGLILSAFLFALTAWSIPAIIASACGDHFGSRLASAALGLVTLFLGIGQALGPGYAGKIADATGSFSQAFIFAAAAALLGCFASLLLRRSH